MTEAHLMTYTIHALFDLQHQTEGVNVDNTHLLEARNRNKYGSYTPDETSDHHFDSKPCLGKFEELLKACTLQVVVVTRVCPP